MISIIIPSYLSQSTILGCLQSLTSQKTDEPFEIWVINSSDDETPRIVQNNFPAVRIVQMHERVYAGTARNIGIHKAEGDILAFIDADCRAAPDWLNRIHVWHRRGYQAVGGSIVNDSPDNLFSRAEYPLEVIGFSPDNPRRDVRFISAANCSFSRNIFSTHGLFPKIRAGEDMIFCHTLSEKGKRILFDPELKVFHRNDIGLKTFITKQIMHGQHSFIARQMTRLPGSFINHPLLFPVLMPVLPFIRMAGVLFRSLLLKNKLIPEIIQTFPVFGLGCIMWSFGYTKGFVSREEGNE